MHGTRVLVTGAGSGIGRATAVAFAERGASVLAVGRRADALERTAAAHGGIRTATADVTDARDVGRIAALAAGPSGLDALVNNAGIVAPTPLGATSPGTAERLWATNVLGPTLLVEAALNALASAGGSIVNVSSTFGSRPAPGIAQYGASKAALEHLTRSWALELAGRGIRVNAVAPGPTRSEALERSGLEPAAIARVEREERERIPLGRRGEPADVARWVLALADSAAGWVTGQVMGVDGGLALA